MINSDNVIYFLAGATLPTIAFFLLGRKDVLKHPHEHLNDLHLKEEKEENEEHDEDDDEDDSYLVAAQLESRVDPTKWGMKDAPYKVRYIPELSQVTTFTTLEFFSLCILMHISFFRWSFV